MDWRPILKDLNDILNEFFNQNRSKIVAVSNLILTRLVAGHKILIVGNGGSAADAQHFAAELVNKMGIRKRKALPCIALTTDTSTLTAIANDLGYQHVFARQIEALGEAGDVLIAISTSGCSENVLYAIQEAKLKGMETIGLTGLPQGSELMETKHTLWVPSLNTQRIQEAHRVILHVLAQYIDEAFE